MVETVAPSSKRIAPKRAQSQTVLMLRLSGKKCTEAPKPLDASVHEMNRRFLTVETGKYAMTLTPPRASGRGAGSRLAWPLVAKPDGKTNRRAKRNRMKRRRSEQSKAVKLPVDKPATATRLEHRDAESSAMKGTGKTL